MKVENANSGSGMGTTSTREQNKPASKDKVPGESDFLSKQADEAKAAIGQVASEMKAWLMEGSNPVNWTRQHPWIGMGIGAVAGFVTATLIVPSKEEQALKRLARIEEALNPPHRHHEENGKEAAHQKEKGGGFLGTLLKELLAGLAPLLGSILRSQTNDATNPSTPDSPGPAGDPTTSTAASRP